MEYTPELAEVCGIHAGDGYLRNKNYNRELDISGSFEEQDYYDKGVIPLFSRVFGIKVIGRAFLSRRTYGFVIRDKTVVESMHEIGFPYGSKSLSVRAPKFVMDAKNADIKTGFMRGLFDTDGSLSFERKIGSGYCEFKRTHNYYPIIRFGTVSRGLADDIKKLLTDLELRYWVDFYRYKQVKWNDIHRIWLRGQNAIDWIEKVGIRNPSKLSRYLIWKKFGHCPPNTTYAERLSILSGDTIIDEGPVR
jgi:hypothetical protein